MRIIYLSVAGILAFILSFCNNLKAATPKTCSYEPDANKPLTIPFPGYITITEEDGDTAVIYELKPVTLGNKVTMYDQQELVFDGMNVEEARKLLLVHPEYLSKLVGHNIPEGFGPVNALLKCE